jgi:diaminopimelate decarboxylase
VRATELVRRFGTPLLVIDVADVRARMRAATAAFPRVAYAVKAFTSHAMARLAVEEGLDLLCASGGEIEACVRAGVPADRLLLHGNAKTDDELRLAVWSGVRAVIVDHAEELDRIGLVAREAGCTQGVLLRVNPEVEVQTHRAIATGGAGSKFGIARREAAAVARRAEVAEGVRLDGFQGHLGSQILDPEPYLGLLEALAEVAVEADVEPRILDIGGGFGVRYADETPLDVGALGAALGDRLAALARANGWTTLPVLQSEPGRALVGPAGCTLYTILARKQVPGVALVAVDGGMSDNPRPALYDAVHAVAFAGPADGTDAETVTLVGRHCESGDVIAEDTALPSGAGHGDLVAVAGTGAYAYTLASVYNRFGRPAVVAVEEGGARLWLRREDAADLDRLEAPLPPRQEATPPEGVLVRPARPADVPSFLEFWHAVVAEGRFVRTEQVGTSARAYRRRFRGSWTPDDAELVAVAGGRVIGHIVVSRERHPVMRHVATLAIAVAKDRRRQGVGASLLSAAFAWARENGIDKLLLSVYPDNAVAIALYRRFGFIEEGRLARQSRRSYGDVDEILMSVWIGPEGAG